MIYTLPISVLLMSGWLIKDKMQVEKKVTSEPEALSVDELEEIVSEWHPRITAALSYLSGLSGMIGLLAWLTPELAEQLIGTINVVIPAAFVIIGAIGKLISKEKPREAIVRQLTVKRKANAA